MTSEIRTRIVDELSKEFNADQLKKVDLAVAKALQGYKVTREETLPARVDTAYPVEVKEFIARKKVKGCSSGTIRQYEYALGLFVEWAQKDLKEMTDLDIIIFLDYIQTVHKLSSRTLDGIRCKLSSFYTFMYDTGKIQKNPVKSVDPIKYRETVIEPLSDMEMENIRNACQNEKERALVEVLYSTGARISEVAGLNIADIDIQNRRAVITGKGNKQRYIFFNAKSLFALQKYLETRTDDNPALFVQSRAPHNRIAVNGMEFIIKGIGERAGLNKTLHPHLFRHTMATDMLNNGAPIEEVSKILGHEKIETTEIYAKPSTSMLASEHRRCIA